MAKRNDDGSIEYVTYATIRPSQLEAIHEFAEEHDSKVLRVRFVKRVLCLSLQEAIAVHNLLWPQNSIGKE
jgi:hypothetical protein